MSISINLHRAITNNIGDIVCAPSLWFDELSKTKRIEILGFNSSEIQSASERKIWKNMVSEADTIIVGGGGLIEIDFFKQGIKYISKNRKKGSKLVLWGAGHNNWKIRDWREIKQKISLDDYNFDKIGVRDYNSGYRWVPCASCMSPLFDKEYEIKENIVMYAHFDTLKNKDLSESLPKGMPTLDNHADFETVIPFLGSGDLVLTDSFHGMYWATLLGRRVIAFPSSSKFYSARHPVPLCDPTDWMRFRKLANYYPEAIYQCREENLKFSQEVFQWI